MEREERKDRTSGDHARPPARDHPDEVLLDRYRTRELEEAERRRVETHLAGCPSCLSALDRLAAFAETVERGYAAGRAGRREPDWGQLRAAIVARTSGKALRRRGGWLARHAPQAALAVLALIAVGVLVEQGVRGPDDAERALRRPPIAEFEDRGVGMAGRSDAPTVAVPGAEAPQAVDARDRGTAQEGGEATAAKNRVEEADAQEAKPAEGVPAAPAGRDMDRPPPERPADGVSAARVGREMDRRAPEKAADAPAPAAEEILGKEETEIPPEFRRFENRAREALGDRNAALAAATLEQWRDSLAMRSDLPPDLKRAAQTLADSLAAFLATLP